MDTYQIAIFNDFTIMVNGAVCRWNDYDYMDPDYDRQVAMHGAWVYANGERSIAGDLEGITRELPLCEVLRFLHTNLFWLEMNGDAPILDYDLLEAESDTISSLMRLRSVRDSDTF